MLREDSLAAGIVGLAGRLVQFGIALPFELDAGWRALGQPIHIAFERDNGFAVGGRHDTIHAVLKAALQAFGQRVYVLILVPIGGIKHVGSPERGGVLLPPGIQMATRAVQRVANILLGVLAGMQKNILPLSDGLAEGTLGN